jgi:hypothetical protein
MDGLENVNTFHADDIYPAAKCVIEGQPMIRLSGPLSSSSDDSAIESDSDLESEKDHATVDSLFANLRTVIPSNESPTSTPASPTETNDTESNADMDFPTESYHGVDSSLFEEMTKPFISSKDYAQAQLVDLCNRSGSPKGFTYY